MTLRISAFSRLSLHDRQHYQVSHILNRPQAYTIRMMHLLQKFSNYRADVGQSSETIASVIRDRINTARVACVLLMMYVHVPHGQTSEAASGLLANTRLDHWLEALLIEGPGRASAALLSVVSGYLIVYSLGRRRESVAGLYGRRFVSIVLPMFFWASLTCIVYLLLDKDGSSFVSAATSWHEKLNLVLFIYDAPYGATLHLSFLRDLFVCGLLSPLLLMALKKAPGITIGVLIGIYLFAHSGQFYIVLRPLVILGFATGMLLALHKVNLGSLDKYWAWFLALTGVFAVLIIWTSAGLLSGFEVFLADRGVSLQETFLYPLCRLSGSLAIWTVLPLLRGTRLTRLVDFTAPYLFAAFCSHFLVLSLLFNGFWLPLVGDRDAHVYLLWFVTAPLISMAIAMVIVNAAVRIYPPLATLITGGRMSTTGARRRSTGKLVQTA